MVCVPIQIRPTNRNWVLSEDFSLLSQVSVDSYSTGQRLRYFVARFPVPISAAMARAALLVSVVD